MARLTTFPWVPPGDDPETGTEFGPPSEPIQQDISSDNLGAIYEGTSVQDAGRIFVDYRIRNRYERDPHIYMMGISSPNGFINQGQFQGAAFSSLSLPTLLWISEWTAAKLGECPEYPDPYISITSGWVLMDDHYETAMVTVANDGKTPLYRLSGTFVYGALVPPILVPQFAVRFPRPPWLRNVMPRNVVPGRESDFLIR